MSNTFSPDFRVGDRFEVVQRDPKKARFENKRIAMVTFSPYPGDPRPRRAIDAFLSEGAAVDLVCIEDGEKKKGRDPSNLGVSRLPLKNRRGGSLLYAYQYGAFILLSSAILGLRSLKRRYDLVYINNMPDILVISALVPKILGSKVILDLHDPMPELMMTIFNRDAKSLGVRLLSRLEKWSMARANLVLTVNIACKRIFASRSCDVSKIGVVMNAPDSEIFAFRQVPPDFVSGYENPSRQFVMMYHGSLVERNGLDLAVDALSLVRRSVPSAELRVYGKSSSYLERVMDTVRDRGMQDAVSYLGPRRLEDLVPEILKCDLGVIPNQRNPFTEINTPTRIFEYLALGKPVVAPRTPGIQDYFAEESLIFFESGNAKDLAAKIETVYHCRPEALETARKGQKVFLAHTWHQERQTLINLVDELIGQVRA